MKTKTSINFLTVVSLGLLINLTGCASMSGQPESGKDIASTGPTIMNARTTPTTIQLNQNLVAVEKPAITADVKDFNHKISDVKLKFVHVPVEVPMENMGGTTWRATLSTEQLQLLAVTGKTVRYEANVVASNDKGQTAISQTPVTISIKAPELPVGGSS
jgi:hypothetical protein